MTVIDKAVEWAVGIANDPAHGYDQTYRWGEYGDYDCSSLVISAYKQAGVPLSCTYTGNMKQDMLRNGFRLVTDGSRRAGDILLNELHHTAMMIDEARLVQASQNELGGVTGGQPGDQTGGEINIRTYYDFPWDCVLRYEKGDFSTTYGLPEGNDKVAEESSDTYTVVGGDTLYGIAQRFGLSVNDIAKWNSIPDPSLIYPGQVLQLREPDAEPECEACRIELPEDDDRELYTVQPGDTLSGIAYQKYGRWNYYFFLARYNNLPNAHQIYVGQKIKIPPVEKLLNQGGESNE